MVRRIFATLMIVVMGLLSVPAFASAGNPPYPAPPVDPAVSGPIAPVVDSVVTADPGSLASTGAGFSVGFAVAIGAAVLVIGLFLLLAGNRMRKSSTR